MFEQINNQLNAVCQQLASKRNEFTENELPSSFFASINELNFTYNELMSLYSSIIIDDEEYINYIKFISGNDLEEAVINIWKGTDDSKIVSILNKIKYRQIIEVIDSEADNIIKIVLSFKLYGGCNMGTDLVFNIADIIKANELK